MSIATHLENYLDYLRKDDVNIQIKGILITDDDTREEILVGDTDGFNFSVPDDVEKYVYTSNGNHHFNKLGKTYMYDEL